MYIYYILRGSLADQAIEREGDIEAAKFPGVDLEDGPAIITHLAKNIITEPGLWTECDLTDDFFNREDTYLFYDDRWMRRSDTPWRRDRG
ncbi:MAG: hypothetical protein NVS3B14_14470 [Ktedonobacteraceae bacterium]